MTHPLNSLDLNQPALNQRALLVVATRGLGPQRPWEAIAKERWFVADYHNSVEVVYVQQVSTLAVPAPIEAFTHIAFTSQNAVWASAARIKKLGPLPVVCVGPATAQTVEQCLNRPGLMPLATENASQNLSVYSARRLAHWFIQHYVEPAKTEPAKTLPSVLWPCGENALADLAYLLKASGCNILPWPVYTTQPLPWHVPQNQHHMAFDLVFTSPSALRLFCENAEGKRLYEKALADGKLYAMGHSTQKALDALKTTSVIA